MTYLKKSTKWSVLGGGAIVALVCASSALSQTPPPGLPSMPPPANGAAPPTMEPPSDDDTAKLGLPPIPDNIPGVIHIPPLPKATRSPTEMPEGVGILMQGAAPANLAPPNADPRNLEGAYIHREDVVPLIQKAMYGNRVPYTQAGYDLLSKRIMADNAATPATNLSAECLPPGPTWQADLNFPFTVFQTADAIYFLFEEYHGVWKIRLKSEHDTHAPAEYMGDSIGHWEGDVLVVETNNFKADMWLDIFGTPLSPSGTQRFRIRKMDGGQALEIITTIDDPVNYRKTWDIARAFQWRPDKVILGEYNCEIQVGDANGVSRYGVK